jgi:hypothetical protein
MAGLSWDPQLRGFLILATGVLILPGSVYLLLATNTGAKLGFVLAVAGFSGWLFLLSLIWTMYGTGMKGNQPSWRVREIVTGSLSGHSALPAAKTFPKGWAQIPTTSPALAPTQSAADAFLVPPPTGAKPPKFPAPFKTTQNYVAVGTYQTGGELYLFRIGHYKIRIAIKHHALFLKHQPRYAVVQVQPALAPITLAGAAQTLPAPDPTQPLTSVVMVRDDGSLRQPNMLISLSAFLVFAVCCVFLHRRDKEIMRLRALAPAGA